MSDSAAVRRRRQAQRNAARNSTNLADYAAAYGANPAAFKGPPRPPTGYYDPTIDHQVSAGQRGLGDLRIDIDTAKRRGVEDRDLTLADLMTSENRTRYDARLAGDELGLQFSRLARGQAEQSRVRGVTSAGLAAEAAQIRAANKGMAQGKIDLSLGRALENINLQRGDVTRGFDRQYGAGGDLDLQLARGEREQPLLEADANELRLAQAKAANWVPPSAAQQRAAAIKAWKRKQRMQG
jgi:hypothetical protein